MPGVKVKYACLYYNFIVFSCFQYQSAKIFYCEYNISCKPKCRSLSVPLMTIDHLVAFMDSHERTAQMFPILPSSAAEG